MNQTLSQTEMNTKYYDVAPGSVTVTQPVSRVVEYEIGGDKITRIMHIITSASAILMFSGAAMVLSGAAMFLKDRDYFHNTIGIVMTIGFGLWILSSLLSFAGSFRRYNKKDGYVWSNIISSFLLLLASVVLVIGAAFWLCNMNLQYTGRIMWIIGGGLLTVSLFIRLLGVFWDATDLYRHETYLPSESLPLRRNEGALVDFKPTKSHKTAIWGNVLASTLYLAGATTFWVATYAMRMLWPTNQKDGFEHFTGILWIISMGLFIAGSIAHFIARK
ncbi:NAD/NADP-dependent betaine aldehyde dehydrogenase [Acrasis kona]|uniref:NAD/NADP-dependent betaine aldehyde dehydrogenase n=1 Tax=Acrasis kona TaxID=1008807 RepID=A0AAW2Z3Y6_9EUKA